MYICIMQIMYNYSDIQYLAGWHKAIKLLMDL